MSHIRKGIIVWYHGNVALKKKIQACANKFLRIIFYLKPRDSVREVMKENKLLSVNQIYNVELAKLMQKHALGTLPAPFTDIYRDQLRLSQIQSRSATQVIQPTARFTKCEQAVRCTGPKVWNNIPNDIKYTLNVNGSPLMDRPQKLGPFVSKIKAYAISSINFI